jgi:hypothetical protein
MHWFRGVLVALVLLAGCGTMSEPEPLVYPVPNEPDSDEPDSGDQSSYRTHGGVI